MCGIAGYIGHRPAVDVVMAGLRTLEYRGYDSTGVALAFAGKLAVRKRSGKLAVLRDSLAAEPLPPATTGIGHTRWATHGAPSEANAHPHTDATSSIAVIHNGIIENYLELRAELETRSFSMSSQTDSEVVAHLVVDEIQRSGVEVTEAVRRVCRVLRGSFALVVSSAADPEVLVAARRNSPLVIGLGDREHFVASDSAAFLAYTSRAVELADDQVAELRTDGLRVTDLAGAAVAVEAFELERDAASVEKGDYPYFMLKEIAEQPQAVADTLAGSLVDGRVSLPGLGLSEQCIRELTSVVVIACGSSYHAGLIAQQAIERWTDLPVHVEVASEFRYREPKLRSTTLVVAVSQSGESMDTLMALRHAQQAGATVVSICNTRGSSMARESHGVLYTEAGTEIGVAATKTFLTQVAAGYLLALHLAGVRGGQTTDGLIEVAEALADIPRAARQLLATVPQLRALAASLADRDAVLFLGRQLGYPVAMEGALKLKELAYLHAEAFAAGELKHGPIALIEDGLPVVVVMPSASQQPLLHEKMMSNIQEVRARGAVTVVIAEQGDESVDACADAVVRMPTTHFMLAPLLASIPLQILTCELALARGCDVDQPRNLAKSVTVE
ncbi:glucosamine--fructose-6-phosphate aminotransferase (isomerizing) [Motilibacter peucedani]|uniref:Glutamine--fructose-6-phosphate aminotransferase [isomerizing] n=1 Tax=Motilibacter peucedani TaxID=598650 RepID=A0A420XLN3_9ACTN|nr:glutamine--fructose-6-phosphate transaminase (isomerizing) [Motilibacter peucedani]RKS71326.1 glucosamine--fructose-6-phosphate aminotransferase (isomerizing) [Motilibacter peucedani]